MDPQDWSRIQQGIFAGESGGDYGALFGYQNRPNGRFSGVDLTKMTVDQALDFANPSGPYGQYVKGQVGRVATPMGAYQIVGTTLRAAKEGLGLQGDEVLTPAMQDKLGQWIYKTQGTGAWEGYKPMTDAQSIAAETMSLLGKGPQITTSTKGPMMQQEQKPQGLLGSLGIQKRDEAAGGETAQPFYQRDTFKDTAAILAQGFGRMGIMGMEEIADDIAKQRTENKAKNKTLEYLRKMPNGDQLVELAQVAGPKAVAEFVMKQRLATPKAPEYETKVIKLADGSEAMVERMKGTNDPWQPSRLPAGGTTGTGAPTKKLTEGQSKLTLFQTLQNETQPVLLELEKQFNPANLADPTMARLPIAGNYFTSPEYQMYKAAASAWAEGALRISTGAAATQPEIERNLQTYFAQPGDTPQTVAFKAQMREMYDRAVNGALGQTPTGERLPIPTPADFATQVTGGSPSSAVNDVNAILGDG